MEKSQRQQFGIWYTQKSPFGLRRVQGWLEMVQRANLLVVEPFAGSGNISKMLPGVKWGGLYDINPPADNPLVQKHDSLASFPTLSKEGVKYGAVITNPPWLAKSSAIRSGVAYATSGQYDNLYKEALALSLKNCSYVMAIVPDSFVTSKLFRNRLTAIVRTRSPLFGTLTEFPSVVAIFEPYSDGNFELWDENVLLGTYRNLTRHPVFAFAKDKALQLEFNNANGELGFRSMDTRRGNTIAFFCGKEIPSPAVKKSSRAILRIKLPKEALGVEFVKLVSTANRIIEDFRQKTFDVTLTAAKSPRKDGSNRRRMDRETARIIISMAVEEICSAARF